MRPCWSVQLPSAASFAMVGAESTHADALASVRLIWPEAYVE